MIGKFQLQLGSEQFISGMASSDYAPDGGLGTSSYGLNPFVTPGLMRMLASGSDVSTSVAGNIIASCEDSQIIAGNNRTCIDDLGNYYTVSGVGVFTKTNTAITNVAGYKQGFSDMVSFAGNTYVTTNGNIDLWNTSSLTLTQSWWTSAPQSQTVMSANYPQPMLRYTSHLYVASANKIHSINSAGAIDSADATLPALPLTLDTNDIIHALGIDPGTGLMLISIQANQNVSDVLTSKFYIGMWDGVSATLRRKVPVDDLVTAFYNLEGIVYVGQGQTIGRWNGAGITFLRKLSGSSYDFTRLPYKHHFCNTRNILHIVDGYRVLSYGASVSGKMGFYYTAYNPQGNSDSTNKLSAVMPIGSDKVVISCATNKAYLYDFASTSAGSGIMYFNNIYFPRPVFIRRIRVVTTNVATTSQFGIGGVAAITESGGRQPIGSLGTFVNTGTAAKNVFDFDFTDLKCMSVQPRIIIDTQGVGIIRVYVFYDVAE